LALFFKNMFYHFVKVLILFIHCSLDFGISLTIIFNSLSNKSCSSISFELVSGGLSCSFV
jgi:hypothetical protein